MDVADYDGGNTTGFVSPAGDSLESPIDLAEILDLSRPHRYVTRVAGDGLVSRGILHADILVVDASAAPAAGRICIAFIQGEVVVAELERVAGEWRLKASDTRAEAISITGEGAEVWGIVSGLVRPEV